MYVFRPVKMSALAEEICSPVCIAGKREFTSELSPDCSMQTPVDVMSPHLGCCTAALTARGLACPCSKVTDVRTSYKPR